jgi:hypothetical protein
MALKFKISKSIYDALSDDVKKEYVAGEGDGEYVLDVTDLPKGEDPAPIKRALENERNAHKETKTKLGEATAKIESFPDVEALKTQHAAESGKLKQFADKTLRDSVASSIAGKISTVPSLLAPKIAERISVDMSGDEPKTVFLGKDGKPDTSLTVEKISEEFVANPDYKGIIIASKASGGGAPGKPLVKPLGGGAPQGEQGKPFNAAKAKPTELVAHLQAKKAAEAQE